MAIAGRRRSHRVLVAVASLIFAASRLLPPVDFVLGRHTVELPARRESEPGKEALTAHGALADPSGAAVAGRRRLLAGFLASAAPVAVAGAAEAEEGKKTPPQALEVSGRKSSPYEDINGRWSIVLGSIVNKRNVYKRDGTNYYLLYNDCGQFQMSETTTGSCDGFAVNEKGVWSFKGVQDANVKVGPAGKGPPPIAQSQKKTSEEAEKKRLIAKELVQKEIAKLEAQSNTETFRGTMDDEDEQVGDRLMSRMGATIKKGY